MSEPLLLAIDQGTTGTTALLLNEQHDVVAKATCEFAQSFPRPGWVEHDADAIWRSIATATTDALDSAKKRGSAISAIGITNQRETTGLFDARTSALQHPFIVWQCRRTEEVCRALIEQGHQEFIRDQTGLVIDPYFSATKLGWLLDHVNGARAKATTGEWLFGTIDSWLVHRMTQGARHVTDATNASRTSLMNLATGEWDDALLELFNIPAGCLPEIRSSSELYGTTRGVDFLPDGIPIAGIAGDQQAALFGQACFAPGDAKCTFGTGCFLLLNTGPEIVHSSAGLLTTVAIRLGDVTHYALEGAAFIGGAAVQWLRDGLGIISTADEIERLAATVESSGDVCFVPALAGLGAPHWRPEARGALLGLSRDTDRGHIARAVLEGIALQNRDILDAMSKDAPPLTVLRVDGGAAANDLLMQFQADILGVPCVRPAVIETTALGAATLAGLAVGVFRDDDDLRRSHKTDRSFDPRMDDTRRNQHLDKWRRAVAKA